MTKHTNGRTYFYYRILLWKIQKMLPLFHLVVIAVNSFTIWYDQKYVDFPFRKELLMLDLPLKRRFLLLTMWGLVRISVFIYCLSLSVAIMKIIGTLKVTLTSITFRRHRVYCEWVRPGNYWHHTYFCRLRVRWHCPKTIAILNSWVALQLLWRFACHQAHDFSYRH